MSDDENGGAEGRRGWGVNGMMDLKNDRVIGLLHHSLSKGCSVRKGGLHFREKMI